MATCIHMHPHPTVVLSSEGVDEVVVVVFVVVFFGAGVSFLVSFLVSSVL